MADGVGENASAPSKTCRKCKNTAQSGLKCVRCDSVSHASCVKLLKNIRRIDDKTIDCCNTVDQVGKPQLNGGASNDVSDENKTLILEISYLKKLLEHKQLLIENQNTTIWSLQEQIKLLNKVNVNKQTYATSVSKHPNTTKHITDSITTNPTKINTSLPSSINIDKGLSTTDKVNSSTIINKPDKKSAATVQKNAAAVDSAVNNVKSVPNGNNLQEEPFIEVSYKKRRPRTSNSPIIGELELNSEILLKAAPKLAFLHVYRLHPDTKSDDVINFLKPTFSEVTCEQLRSVKPESYSSFKVTIDNSNLTKAMNPASWPKGTCINRFFHSKNTPATSLFSQ
ncbi:hypothetical protein RI129_006469 [Pyrocoelia pectoralis]|uniref:Uncharacterized protein n=1 Tax=Pyrocoelia pectoralis TaxID=417401 RepID=A0AAN7VK53_9COLE